MDFFINQKSDFIIMNDNPQIWHSKIKKVPQYGVYCRNNMFLQCAAKVSQGVQGVIKLNI
jgi:hypothetical protein